jgi:hypothetical protein
MSSVMRAAAVYTLLKQVFSTDTRSSAVRDGNNLLQLCQGITKLKIITRNDFVN